MSLYLPTCMVMRYGVVLSDLPMRCVVLICMRLYQVSARVESWVVNGTQLTISYAEEIRWNVLRIQVSSASSLRACCAMSGTGVAAAYCHSILRACYAVSGTHIAAYARATQCPVLTSRIRLWGMVARRRMQRVSLWRSAVEKVSCYPHATPCPVLTYPIGA
eukprot:2017991-Rhodomonas_salina.2